MLDMTRAVYYGPKEPGEWVDADGLTRWKEDRDINGGVRHRPFADEDGAREWLARAVARRKREARALDLKRYADEHRRRFLQLQGYIGDDTVVLEECETGLDEVRAALGLEWFAFLDADCPELIREFIAVSTEQAVRIVHATADKTLTPYAMVAGDIAMKGRLIHSPEWLRREFFPSLRRLITAWHEHEIKVLFHSDGYLMDILPDLVAAGIDGLNPIETTAGMSLKEVKAIYGSKLFLTGGIDMSQLLSRTSPDEVRAACRAAMRDASPGYFIGSTSELDNSARLENILAMLETAKGDNQA